MTLDFSEDSFWDAPTLITQGEQGCFFCNRSENGWVWQEKAGQIEETESETVWGEAQPLPHRGEKVCATLDAAGRLHLIVLEAGCFYHLQRQQGRFSEELFYKEESKLCSHLHLVADTEGALHLIYLASDNAASRWWLLHHRFTENGWEEPRVIDFGGGNALNYGSAAPDRGGSLHLAYRIVEHDQVGLYYRCFSTSSLSWSKAVNLAAANDINYPSIIADETQNLHVLWTAARGSHYQVSYRPLVRGGWPSSGWKPEIAISPPLTIKPFPFFTYQQGKPAMAWLDGDTLNLFRQENGDWVKGTQQQLEAPRLIRCVTLRPLNTPLLYWVVQEQACSDISHEVEASAYDGSGLTNLELDLDQLQRYSISLISHTSELTSTKRRLEGALEEKRKELTWVAQQNQRKMMALQQSLSEKDKELHELEQKFNQTLNSLKQKSGEARKVWDEDRKRCYTELQQYKKERRQFDQILKDKENTIERLEARLRELEYRVKSLVEDKEALEIRLQQRSSQGIKKILGRLLHNKP